MADAKTHEAELQKLRKIIQEIDLCMLTTIDGEGRLHSRPMSNNQEVEFDGDLWFFTYGSTPEVEEIRREPRVNVSFADTEGQRYVSLSGTAEVVRDREKMRELWRPHLKAWFPQGVEEPDIALLKVTAQHAEYWESPAGPVAHVIGFVNSLATGRPAAGENEKLDLEEAA